MCRPECDLCSGAPPRRPLPTANRTIATGRSPCSIVLPCLMSYFTEWPRGGDPGSGVGGTRRGEGDSHHALPDLPPSINSLSANQCVNINGSGRPVGGTARSPGRVTPGRHQRREGEGRGPDGPGPVAVCSPGPASPARPVRPAVFCFDAVRRSLMNQLSVDRWPPGGHIPTLPVTRSSRRQPGRPILSYLWERNGRPEEKQKLFSGMPHPTFW